MPFTAAAYKGRPKFNEAWENMCREIHLEMLAKPNPRVLKPWPDPTLVRPTPAPIPPEALKYEASPRIVLMSKYNPRLFTPKYVPEPPKEVLVPKHCLEFQPSPRLIQMAIPIKKILPKRKRVKSTKRLMRERKFREKRPEWLALRAVPRKYGHRRVIVKKGPCFFAKEGNRERMNQMAKPVKHVNKMAADFDPFRVSPLALKHEASEREKELSNPRPLLEETILDLEYNPYIISPAALKYTPNEKIKNLAQPLFRPKAVELDVKEDAFSVPKRALKAKCTKRVAELAIPIHRE